MKKIYFFVVFLALLTHNKAIAQPVKGLFTITQSKLNSTLSNKLSKGQLMSVDQDKLSSLFKEATDSLYLEIPYENKNMVLEMARVSPVSNNFLITASGEHEDLRITNYKMPVFYRGSIGGMDQSFVAITLYEDKIVAEIADSKGNISLTPLDELNAPTDYILYRDADLLEKPSFDCNAVGTVGEMVQLSSLKPSNLKKGTFVGKPVNIYFECDYKMYQDFGNSVDSVINYVLGFFNVVSAIYANENINIQVSQIKVWTTTDPEASIMTTGDILDNFRNRMVTTSYTGDLAHFLTTKGGLGGMGEILDPPNQCKKLYRTGVSGIYKTYTSIMSYSWTVEVVAHELGHNLSSVHTQSCTWPGGPIDNCVAVEGRCDPGPTPTNGGTIMSYCHITPIGINFSNGFGPLPGQKIRDFVAQFSCPSVNCTLAAVISKQDPACNASNGSATISITGAQGAISYLWSNGKTDTTIKNLPVGEYYVTVSDEKGCQVLKGIELKSKGDLIPSVSLNTTTLTICEGSVGVLTAKPVNGGKAPIYQWKVNGKSVWRDDPVLNAYNLKDGDTIKVIMISSANCLGPTTAESNPVIVKINKLETLTASISANVSLPVCKGTNASFTATGLPDSYWNTYQWKLNGDNVGTNSKTYNSSLLNDGDTISVVVTNPYGCLVSPTAISNKIIAQIVSSITPTASISISPTGIQCQGTSRSFAASTNVVNPSFQWKVNGTNTGSNSSSFTSNSLNNNDVVTVIVTPPSGSCYTSSNITSNTITVQNNSLLTPTVSISSNASGAVCQGTSITLTASPTNAGSTPQYQWKLNGVNTGANSPTLASSAFINGDVVSVTVTPTVGGCYTSSTAASNNVTLNITTPVTPTVSINVVPANIIFSGDMASFTASATNAGASPSFQWMINGTPTGSNSSTLNTTQLKNNDVVSLSLATGNGCFTNTTATANLITMMVNAALAANNYSVKATDETCKDKNDGKLDITVANTMGYTVKIAGVNYSQSQNLAGNTLSLSGLQAGNYEVCFTPNGMSSYYTKCFNAVINEPKDLSVYLRSITSSTISLLLQGSDSYFVSLNGKDYTIHNDTITLPVQAGMNRLIVQTSKTCQGIYTNEFEIGNQLLVAYPNPTEGWVNLKIGGVDDNVSISVYTKAGRRIIHKSFVLTQDRSIQLNLSGIASSTYFIKVTGKTMNETLKIIKN